MSIVLTYRTTPLDTLLASGCPYTLCIQIALTADGSTQLTETPPVAWAAWLREHALTLDDLARGVNWLFETPDARTAWATACTDAIEQMLREVGTSVLVPPSMIQVMLYG